MKQKNGLRQGRAGFTLIELVTVIVILGILSAVALPVYLDYRTDARAAACKGALGGVRAAIANYYSYSATPAGGGTPRYPTAALLRTAGRVMADAVPANPYDTDATPNNVVGTSNPKGTVTGGSGGWCYNATNGQFWANTNTAGENNF